MWRPWSRSTLNHHDPTLPPPPPPPPSLASSSSSSPSSSSSNSTLFSVSSFKDIQHLCEEEDPCSLPVTPPRLSSVFHRIRLANSIVRSLSSNPSVSDKRVVVYFTSIRVVRSTFDDCRFVLSIFQALGVPVDERDLAMDSGFIKELQQIFGQTKLTLPRVFIGGRYLGGADEIRELHEVGELKKFLENLPSAKRCTCTVCGGYRFILCNRCNGSHKLYIEKSGFRSCTACNENGLIRCPSCSCAPM